MHVLCALPERDFDPTEAAIPWLALSSAGHSASFATPSGTAGAADPSMLTGEGLDPWARIGALGGIRPIGSLLRADEPARDAYAAMSADSRFNAPARYDELDVDDFDALLLPGGHYARGMRAYLESTVLQGFVADFFDAGKPVAAICHGVVLAARSVSKRTGHSSLYGKKTTALTWSLENRAASLGRVARFWEPDYYRTYPDLPGEPPGFRGVQAEVSRALASPADFIDVPRDAPDYRRKTDGLHRDSPADSRAAWVVTDGNYVSARWPGDAHAFARAFVERLASAPIAGAT